MTLMVCEFKCRQLTEMWFYILVLVVAVAAGEQRKSLSTPRRIMAKPVTAHSIEVSWRDPDLANRGGAKSVRQYIVRYREIDESLNGTDTFETVRTRQRSIRLHHLIPNTTYDIWVRAVKLKKSSAWSKVVRVATPGHQDQNYIVRNLTATPVSSDAILLSWLPPEQSNNVVAYTILTQLANGNGRQKKDVASSAMLEYKVGHLRPNLLYSFRVQTMQKVAPHPISPAVLSQPFSDVPSGPPKDVMVHLLDSENLLVTWQPPSPHQRNGQILGYTLHYKYSGAREGDIVSVSIINDTREYSLTNLPADETYMIQIAAYTINGTGPYTNWETLIVEESKDTQAGKKENIKDEAAHTGRDEAAHTGRDDPTSAERPRSDHSLKPPSEVKVINKTGSSVFLAWTLPEVTDCCPVVAYKIMIRNYNASSDYEIVRGSTHVHLPGLSSGTLYGVRVTSMGMTEESRPSEEVLFTTGLTEPPLLVFYQTGPAYLGGDANLTCKGRGYDALKIDWLISPDLGIDRNHASDSNLVIAGNVKIIASLENDFVISSLLIYNMTKAAEREFVCVGTNSLGLEKRRLYLIVNEPPRIVTSHGTTTTIGGVARLGCEAYGKPVPHITWVHSPSGAVYNETRGNDKDLVYATSILLDSNHTRQSILVIKNSSIYNQGVYVCMAQSTAGRTEAQVMFNVKVPPPGPVHKIQTIPLSPSRVSVSWLPPLSYGYNIAYYQVSYRKKRGGQPSVFNTTRVGTELYDLDHSTEYLVGVIAGTEDSLGESGPEVDVMTLTNDGLQPANVSVKSLNTSIIQLDWEAPYNISPRNIRGYNVYTRREGEERIEKLFVKGSSSKQFLIGLGRDDTYYLKISTLMTWGYEAHSPWIRIQKRSEAMLPPGKPLIVTSVAKFTEITLTWEPPPMGQPGLHPSTFQIKGYKILYGPVNDPLNVSRATLEADKRSYVIMGLEPSKMYMISIRAYNDVGDGEPVYTRTQTQALPPSMVQNASARPISSTEIHVQWEHPQRGQVTQYHIRYWRPGRKDKQSAWLTGNFKNYVAGSLRKNSNYRFEIIPYNGELLGEGIVIFSYTYGDKPDGPPTNVTLRTLNSTTLSASWGPPDPEKANGLVIAYKLVLRSKGGSRTVSFTVPETKYTYIFLNTPVSRMYKFRVAAITVNGTGVFSPWVEYAASLSSERPAPPQNLSVTETETSLTLHWKAPLFTGTAVHGYIVGYGQFIPEVYRHILSASQMSYVIKLLKPDSEYITSVRAFNNIGESPPTLRIVRTKAVSPLTTPLLAPVKLMVRSESPTSLTLSWVDPVLNEIHRVLDGRAYLIRFSPLSGETYSYVNTSHLQYRLSDLEPASKYEVSVKVVRGSNSSTWSLPVVNSTQQIAPSTAPERIVASSLRRSLSLISLKWSEPHSLKGKIEEYIIYLTSDPLLDIKLWVVMRTDKQEVKIKDILPYTTYYFKLQARNNAGYGPLSETVVYMPPTDVRAVPTNVTVAGSNISTTVKVTWSVPEVSLDQVTGYSVHFTANTKDDTDWLVHTERGPDAVIDGLAHNTTYYFKVQARFSEAYGPFSRTVSYTTFPQVIKPTPSVEGEDRAKNDASSRGRANRMDAEGAKHDELNRDRANHNDSSRGRAKHDGGSRDRAKEEAGGRDRAKEDDVSRDRAKDDDGRRDGAKLDNVSRDRAKEGDGSRDRAKEDDVSRDRAKQDDGSRDRAKEGDGSRDRAKEDDVSRDRAKQDDGSRDRAKEEAGGRDGAKLDNVSRDRAKQDDVSRDRAKQDDVSRDRAKQDDVSRDRAKEDDVSRDRQDDVSRDRQDDVSRDRAKDDNGRRDRAKQDDVSRDRQDDVSRDRQDDVSRDRQDDVSRDRAKLDDVSRDRDKLDDVSRDRDKLDDVSRDRAKLDDVSRDRAKLDDVSRDRAKDDDVSRDRQDDVSRDRAKLDGQSRDRAKEDDGRRDSQDDRSRDRAEDVDGRRDGAKQDGGIRDSQDDRSRDRHDDVSRDRAEHDDRSRDRAEHDDRSRDRAEHHISKDRSEHDRSRDRSEHHISKDRAEHDRSRDRSEHDRRRDRSEHDRSRDRSEHDRSRDRSEHDRSRDRSEHDRSRDRSEHDRSRDRSEHDRSRDGGEYGRSSDKAYTGGFEDSSVNNDSTNIIGSITDSTEAFTDSVHSVTGSVDSATDSIDSVAGSFGRVIDSDDTSKKNIDNFDKVTGSITLTITDNVDNIGDTFNSTALKGYSTSSTVDNFEVNTDSVTASVRRSTDNAHDIVNNIGENTNTSNDSSGILYDSAHDSFNNKRYDKNNESKVDNVDDDNETYNRSLTVKNIDDDEHNFDNEGDVNVTGREDMYDNIDEDDKYEIADKDDNVDYNEKDDTIDKREKDDNFDHTQKDDTADITEKDDNVDNSETADDKDDNEYDGDYSEYA